MHELVQAIPEADLLLALEPEELAAKMLFGLRRKTDKRNQQQEPFLLSNLLLELWPQQVLRDQQTAYPRAKENEINLALSEAWAWLVAQGLLVPYTGSGTAGEGWRVLSRRAKRFQDESEFSSFSTARMLEKDSLHSKMRDKVWAAFMRGEFDVAVLQAMKTVEVAVREASGLPNDLIGVALMRKAFHPQDGPLTDQAAEQGEKDALSALFAGAIGCYKNPHYHRDVQLDDQGEAVEIIMFANHLLRIVDARRNNLP